MAEQYLERAVDAMRDHLALVLPGKITAVEAELGLSAGDMPAPVDYIKQRILTENRTPLIQVFDVGGFRSDQQDDGIFIVPVMVRISRLGTADIEANEMMMRRYVTAIMDSVLSDDTLGSRVSGANFEGGEPDESPEGATTRHNWTLLWDVIICVPSGR